MDIASHENAPSVPTESDRKGDGERSLCVALDVMSGDHGAAVVLPAAREVLESTHDFARSTEKGLLDPTLILVGAAEVIEPEIAAWPAALRDRVRVVATTQVVTMHDLPAIALRNKRDSSMRRAIDLVKCGEADACVSAGNTGALMATARYVLKTLPGIDRPAIATAIPSLRGHTHMLDLGANVDVEAEHLYQFAVMGSVLVTAVDGVAQPRVGLLNIGAEAIKGNDRVKEASRLLEASALNYCGFVEGNDVFLGDVDVVVCDGFVGNVALKTTEGVAKLISQRLREAFQANWATRIAGLVALPVLKGLRRRIDPRRYNGASLLGLQGIVVKSHGGADQTAFANAVSIALAESRAQIPRRIDRVLGQLLQAQVAESASAGLASNDAATEVGGCKNASPDLDGGAMPSMGGGERPDLTGAAGEVLDARGRGVQE